MRLESHSGRLLTSLCSMTGSGKTTFIANATGRKDLKIGHDLTSCTALSILGTNVDALTDKTF
jgi:hypothetical protein